MTHVRSLEDVQLGQHSTVTIGVFDGIHRGHQALIRRLVSEAHAQEQQAVVLTFFPHPDVVLRNITTPYYLTSVEQRAALLIDLGVDLVVTHPFDEAVRNLRARNFVSNLVNRVQMQSLWVGKDFALGYQREGNITYLSQLGTELGYNVQPIELIHTDDADKRISSTAIRDYLKEGDVEAAAQLLGRSYCVEGEVVRGDQRGRTIGFPTANMAVWQQQILPKNGVYAGWATLGAEQFMAVTNVGVRPTFDGQTLTVEPHLLDFDRDIYGETLSLTFEARLRSEMKFDGLDAIKSQLARDVEHGRAFLSAEA